MSLRTERVAALIKEEVGIFILREYSDPGYGLITITDVHVSPDLRIAKIYVSIMGSPEVKTLTMEMLERNKGEIRSFVGQLRLKFTPSIHFYLDETMERVDRIEKLIRQIHKSDDAKPE